MRGHSDKKVARRSSRGNWFLKKELAQLLIIFCTATVGLPSIVNADYKRGMSAYAAGEYLAAFKEFSAAAEKGDRKSEYALGMLFIRGEGVNQNYSEGVKWLTRAAEHGYLSAQFALGNMYERGEGLPQNFTEAIRWYREAAEHGDSMAQYNLGLLYVRGEGVKQDYAEARRWIQKSAEQGEIRTYHDLGVMYAQGLGGPKDYVQAYLWLSLSATSGEIENAQLRDSLESAMTRSQIAEAKKLAREWKPKKNVGIEQILLP